MPTSIFNYKIKTETSPQRVNPAPAIIIAIASIALPYSAFGVEKIPFNFDNQLPDKSTISCQGPWSRTSKTVTVKGNHEHKDFYSSDVNIFSPFGLWSCIATYPADSQEMAGLTFCLKKSSPQPPVNLILTNYFGGATLCVDENCGSVSSCNNTSTAAILGDDTSFSGNDTDSYRMEGLAGDLVEISLEGDGDRGHQGDQIVMQLIQEQGPFKQDIKGTIPLQLETTLPNDGSYRIIIKPHGKSSRNQFTGSGESGPFRGNYVLNVSTSAEHIELIPHQDVEE